MTAGGGKWFICMENQAVKTLLEIPFKIDAPALKEKLRIKPGTESEKKLEALVEAAQEIGRPKALYRVTYIDSKGEETISMDGVTFTSAAMRKNVDGVNRVFAYVATCGEEILELKKDSKDLIQKYWLSMIRTELLFASQQHLLEEIQRAYQIESLSTMNPGSGEANIWPIEQQRELFSLLGDVKEMIGVELKPSYLMSPDMSVSGIIFASDQSYINCMLCQRENCPGRRAPFDCELWEEIHQEKS
jgi:hypothetical protein